MLEAQAAQEEHQNNNNNNKDDTLIFSWKNTSFTTVE
jgi:hypothetical protein